MKSELERAGVPIVDSIEKVNETDIDQYQDISVLASIQELQDDYTQKTDTSPNVILLGFNTVLAFLFEIQKDTVVEFDDDGTPIINFQDEYQGNKIIVMPESDYIGVTYRGVQVATEFFLKEKAKKDLEWS